MNTATTAKIALLTGGDGPERFGSLRSGESVTRALTDLGIQHDVHDISNLSSFNPKLYDFAFLTTHGWFGEDGKLQGYLEHNGLPYTGSGVLASAVGMYKPLCNQLAASLALSVPAWTLCNFRGDLTAEADRILRVVGQKMIVKPVSGGGSIDAAVLTGLEELTSWLVSASQGELEFMAQRHVRGVDVTIGIVDGKEGLTLLPPLATRYESVFYDFDTKHDSSKRVHICPAELSEGPLTRIRDQARRLFTSLKAEPPFRVDFLVDDEEVAWFLEVNTIPGLSREGNMATMAGAHGISYEQLIKNTVRSTQAREKGDYRQ